MGRLLPTIATLALTACVSQRAEDSQLIQSMAKRVTPGMRVSDVLQSAESRRGKASPPRVRIEQCEGVAYRIIEPEGTGYALLTNERPSYADTKEVVPTREAALELVDRLSLGCKDVAVSSGVSALWMELDAEGKVRTVRREVHGS